MKIKFSLRISFKEGHTQTKGFRGFGKFTFIIALMMLLSSKFAFAQVPDSLYHLVSDRFGNTYSHGELYFSDSIDLITACSDTDLFVPVFLDSAGEGFYDATDGADRRDAVCKVLSDLSDLIVAQVGCDTFIQVRIEFRSADVDSVGTDIMKGMGSGYYDIPYGMNSGIIDGRVWLHINTGTDPVRDEADGYVTINFNSAIDWNYDYTGTPSSGQIDLYQIVLREMMHAIGFNSLIDENGTSILSHVSEGLYSRFDQFLEYTDDSSNTFSMIVIDSLGNATFNIEIDSAGAATGGDCDHVRFNGDNATDIPVYAPADYELGTSLSFLVSNCGRSTDDYLMNWSDSILVRIPTDEEASMLCDLGYTTSGIFDTTTNLPDCGFTVAGVDDGMPWICGDTLIIITDTIPVTITGFLDNDINAVGFTALQLLNTNMGSVSNITTTGFDFTLMNNGLALLSYIPVDSFGNYGNTTRIIVHLGGGPCNCPGCNQVCNSTFTNNTNPNSDYLLSGIILGQVDNWTCETGSSPDWASGDIGTTLGMPYQNIDPPTPVDWGFGCMVVYPTAANQGNFESSCEPINTTCLNVDVVQTHNYILSLYEFNLTWDNGVANNPLDEFHANFYNGILQTWLAPNNMVLPNPNQPVIDEVNIPAFDPITGDDGWRQYIACVPADEDYEKLVIYGKNIGTGGGGIQPIKYAFVDRVELVEDIFMAQQTEYYTCGGSIEIGEAQCTVDNMFFEWYSLPGYVFVDDGDVTTVTPTTTTDYALIRSFISNPDFPMVTTCPAETLFVTVTVNPNPTVTINAVPPNICSGSPAVLTASPGPSGYTYLWSTTQTTQSISVTTAGTYYVTVTNTSTGCTGTASVTVGSYSSPTVNAGSDQTIYATCGGPTSCSIGNAASGGASPYTYLWSNSATTATQTVNASAGTTTYTVTVTDANGCTASDAVLVTVILPYCTPSILIGTSYWICSGTYSSSLPWGTLSPTTLGSNVTVIIEGKFIIDNDFTIEDLPVKVLEYGLSPTSCGQIYVAHGSTSDHNVLTIDNCDISAGCDHLWFGIEAEDYRSDVIVTNGSIIRFAKYGLYTTKGGIFKVDGGSTIKNCAQGMHIEIENSVVSSVPYNGSSYPGFVRNATITDDVTLISLSSICNTPSLSGLWVDGTNIMGSAIEIRLGNSTSFDVDFKFGEDDLGSGYTTYIQNFDQYGILCFNANLEVVNTQFALDYNYGVIIPGDGTSKAAEWGIYCTTNFSGNGTRNIQIGGAGSYQPNTFDLMSVGIYSENKYGGNIEYNTFNNNTSQAVNISATTAAFHITDNDINDTNPPGTGTGTDIFDVDMGIHAEGLLSGSVYIERNDLLLQRVTSGGIRFHYSQNSSTGLEYIIDDNYLRVGRVGILVQGYDDVQISNNEIDLDKVAGSGAVDYCGIRVQASVNPVIQGNIITRTFSGSTSHSFWGIDLQDVWDYPGNGSLLLPTGATGTYICLNDITDMHRSLNFGGADMNGATILNNTFTDGYTSTNNYAVYVMNAANIGDQGSSSPGNGIPNDNCFDNQSGDYDTYAINSGSNSFSSDFFYESTGDACLNNVNNVGASGGVAFDHIPLTGSSSSDCDPLPYFMISMEQRLNGDSLPSEVIAIAEERINDSLLTGNAAWIKTNALFRQFANDTALQEQSEIVDAFADSMINEPAGQFYVVDKMITSAFDTSNLSTDTALINQALSLNESITTNILTETLQKEVNDIYIRRFLLENENPDSTELNTLMEIANLCPCDYGHAVFDARSMLYDLSMPGLYFSDAGCICSPVLRVHKDFNKDITVLDFSLYPNPTQGEINLSWTKPLETGYYKFELMNTLGSISKSTTLPSYSTSISVDLREFASGMYFYRILNLNSVVADGKIVVAK